MEFPHFQKMVNKYDPKELVVVTINRNEEEIGHQMMTKQKYGFLNLQAPDESWISKTYQVRGFPTTYVLDPEGKVFFSSEGSSADDIRKMEAVVAALLARAGRNKQD